MIRMLFISLLIVFKKFFIVNLLSLLGTVVIRYYVSEVAHWLRQ